MLTVATAAQEVLAPKCDLKNKIVPLLFCAGKWTDRARVDSEATLRSVRVSVAWWMSPCM